MPPEAVQRILIIRPSALGDVCRSTPVLVSLKRTFPSAQIDWLVQDSFAEAVASHPDLAKVVPFPRAAFARWWSPGVLPSVLRWLRSLRRARYDLVLDCQGLARSGIFAWATRAPVRVGLRSAAEGAWLAYTRRVDTPREMHTVDRMLALAEAAGAPAVRDLRLYAPAEDRRWVADQPWAGQPLLIVAPTSRWPGKRWPADRFAEVIARVQRDRPGTAVALVGSASERAQIPELLPARGGVIDLIGATSIGRLMAVIERSAGVLANDSAALHMAVGFGRPTVALFGPTRVDRVGPYGREHEVVQHRRDGDRLDHKNESAGRALMERIGIDEVTARVLAMLGPSDARRG